MRQNLKPFEREDWFGFAGASKFPDGSPPHIGTISVSVEQAPAIPCTLIVSGEEPGHVEIVLVSDDGYERTWSCTGAAALYFVLMLGSIDVVEVTDMGLAYWKFELIHKKDPEESCRY